MTIGDRIKTIRKTLAEKNTQAEFGVKLGVTREVITSYETGRVIPPEPTIRLISTTYRVNYHWLKDGEGEMYIPAVSDDMLVDEVMAGENEFAKSTFRAFAKLGDAEWQLLKTLVDEITRRDG